MTIESDAVKSVAGLMALSARTAPKAVGLDSIKVDVLTGKDHRQARKPDDKDRKRVKDRIFPGQRQADESKRCHARNRG